MRLAACSGCSYSAEADPEGDVPIPSWVLKYIDATPADLEEIKEINFGIPPARIPMGTPFKRNVSAAPKKQARSEKVKKPAAPILLRRKSVAHYPIAKDAFAYRETIHCVI